MSEQAVAARLREAREYVGMTILEAAATTNIQEEELEAIERGERATHDLELQRLARAYGYSSVYFTSEAEPLPEDAVRVLARLTHELSDHDRAEAMRFAEYLRYAADD